MKRLLHIAAALVLCSLCATQVFAQRSSSASQVVTFSVHRSTAVSPAMVKTAFAKQFDQVDDPAGSGDSSPPTRLQRKLSVSLDSHRQPSFSLDLASAEGLGAAKNELLRTKPQEKVVLTVTD